MGLVCCKANRKGKQLLDYLVIYPLCFSGVVVPRSDAKTARSLPALAPRLPRRRTWPHWRFLVPAVPGLGLSAGDVSEADLSTGLVVVVHLFGSDLNLASKSKRWCLSECLPGGCCSPTEHSVLQNPILPRSSPSRGTTLGLSLLYLTSTLLQTCRTSICF